MEPSININLIDYETAALLLPVRPPRHRRVVSQRCVPHLHVGRLVRFDVRDLEEFLNSKRYRWTRQRRDVPKRRDVLRTPRTTVVLQGCHLLQKCLPQIKNI